MPGGWPTNWKIIVPQKFSHRSKSSEPHVRLPSLGVWQLEEVPPENLALKSSRVRSQEFHRTGGNRNSTLGGCTQGLLCTKTQGKQWTRKRQGQTYLVVLEGLLWRWGGVAVVSCRDKDTGSSNSGEYSLVWTLSEATIFSTRPSPTQ